MNITNKPTNSQQNTTQPVQFLVKLNEVSGMLPSIFLCISVCVCVCVYIKENISCVTKFLFCCNCSNWPFLKTEPVANFRGVQTIGSEIVCNAVSLKLFDVHGWEGLPIPLKTEREKETGEDKRKRKKMMREMKEREQSVMRGTTFIAAGRETEFTALRVPRQFSLLRRIKIGRRQGGELKWRR